ncbi:hypothetical protein Vafri_1721, partial [Volvox africanus]
MSCSSSIGSSTSAVPAAPAWSDGNAMMIMARLPPCTLPEGFVNSDEYVLYSAAGTDGPSAFPPGRLLACSSFLYRRRVQNANTTGAMPKQDTVITSPRHATASDSATREETSASMPDMAATHTTAQGGAVDVAGCSDACGGHSHAAALPRSPGNAVMTLLRSSPSYWGYGPCVCLRVVGGDGTTGSTAASTAGRDDAAVPVAAVAAAASYSLIEEGSSGAPYGVGGAPLPPPLSLPPVTSPAPSAGQTGGGREVYSHTRPPRTMATALS